MMGMMTMRLMMMMSIMIIMILKNIMKYDHDGVEEDDNKNGCN